VGDKSDSEIERHITEELSKSYQITFIKGQSIRKIGEGYELLVFDTPGVESLSLSECIIIMKSGGIPPEIRYPERSIIIANSENAEQISKLSEVNKGVISCGSRNRDTISYSSYTGDCITLSLNREILAFSGKKIEPLEIPFEFSREPDNIYNLLSFTALRLVLDNFNSDIGGLY
jgi:hypothetical protein